MNIRADYRIEVFVLGLIGLGSTVIAVVLLAVGALTPALLGSPALLVGVAGSLLARFSAKRVGGFKAAKGDELFLVGTLLCAWSLVGGSVFFLLLCGMGINYWAKNTGWGWPLGTLLVIVAIALAVRWRSSIASFLDNLFGRRKGTSISWAKGAPYARAPGSLTVFEAFVALILLGSGPFGWLVLLLWHDSKVQAEAQFLEAARIEAAHAATNWDYTYSDRVEAERREYERHWQEERVRRMEEELERERTKHREREGRSGSGDEVLDAYLELGLSPSASFEDVRKAHQRLVLQFHPDRTVQLSGSEREYCTVRFKRIQNAFEALRLHFGR